MAETPSSTDGSPPTSARKPRRMIKVVFLFFMLFLCALLLEGAVRLRLYFQTGSFQLAHQLATHEESGMEIPVPGRVTKTMRIDSRGFRSPELDVPKPEGRFRVAFLGASTTFCAEASSNETTWPHLVMERLRKAYPDVDFDYVNGAVAGFPVERSQTNLRYRVAALEPDLILICHAVNDIALDTRAAAVEQGVYVEHADREGFLSDVSLAWYLLEKNLLIYLRQSDADADTGKLAVDAKALSQGFQARLEGLIEKALEVTPRVALLTFSHQVRREQSRERQMAACNTALYYMPYMTPGTILDCFEAYNDAIRNLAESSPVWLIDGEFELEGSEAHFTDSVHFNDEGCRKMAERVAERVIASKIIQN